MKAGEKPKRVLMVCGIAAAVVVILYLTDNVVQVLLLFLMAILFAVGLRGIADILDKKTFLGRGSALAATVLVLLGAVAAFFWLAGPRITDQFIQLTERLPEAVESIRSYLLESKIGRALWAEASENSDEMLAGGGSMFGHVTTAFSSIADFVLNVLIVLALGIYLAIDPRVYVDNVVLLFSEKRREGAHASLQAIARALKWWLLGRLASMAVVAVLTTLGLMIAGIPLAMTLGVIAGTLSFIPYIGPIAGSIPALLVGLVESSISMLYVAIVYSVVQLLESYLISPIIEKKAVFLPPALVIGVQVLMGVLTGIAGILLATPIAVIVIVLIQTSYVQAVLREDVTILGDHDAEAEASQAS